MATHELKIEKPYFQAVKDGIKTFEIRHNDRGFQAGDEIILKEIDDGQFLVGHGYTGRELWAVIGYVTSYKQQENYVVFSILEVKEKP